MPVIATRVGGIPEVVRDGIDGFLYDVGDINSMADGCLTILSNPALREAWARLPGSTRTRDFCASKIVLQYEELYRRTIREASHR